jgi:hypothetical protein
MDCESSPYEYCTVEFAQLTRFITAAVRSIVRPSNAISPSQPASVRTDPLIERTLPYSPEPAVALQGPAWAGRLWHRPVASLVGGRRHLAAVQKEKSCPNN